MKPNDLKPSWRRFCCLGLLLLTLSYLPGCNLIGVVYLEDVETGPMKEQFLIQSIRLEGTTNNLCAVEAGAQADQDGMADLDWWLHFLFDGGNPPMSLPADDGPRQTHVLRLKATQSSDQQDFHKKVTVAFYE